MKKTKEDLWYYFSISKDMLLKVSYTSPIISGYFKSISIEIITISKNLFGAEILCYNSDDTAREVLWINEINNSASKFFNKWQFHLYKPLSKEEETDFLADLEVLKEEFSYLDKFANSQGLIEFNSTCK